MKVVVATVSSLDPQMEAADEPMSRHIFETPLSLDENGGVQTGLCTYKYSGDALTLTLTLRDGVKFHNGSPVKAEDVAASISRWANNVSFGKSYVGKYMDSISAADEKTVVIKFKSVAGLALTSLAYEYMGAYVMPKAVCEEYPSSPVINASKIIGTGPYKLVEWKQDSYVMTERFADYKATGNKCGGPAGNKYAYSDRIAFYFVKDMDAKANGVLSGEYDYVRNVDNSVYASLKGNSKIKFELIQDGTKPSLVFNKKQGPAANVKFRQAVLVSLDMDAIMKAAFGNPELYDLTGSWAPIGSMYEYSNALYNKPDLGKAKQLLKESGYNNEKVVFLTSQDVSYYYQTALMVANRMKEIGINVDLQVVDQATLYSIRNDPSKYDLFAVGFTAKADPAMMAFLGDSWPGFWISGQKNALMEKMAVTVDVAQKKELWHNMTDLIYREIPVITFGERRNCVLLSNKVNNARYAGSEPYYWNIWLSK
ncbi:MAG: ABC transporter substrate-binding protein [Acidaminococcales bacterium]|nr:ABC transporter substrate-binding protein [Acidaminococcales bacterium]